MPHDGSEAQKLTDTTPRAAARYWERLRATPPRERLERALRLSERVRAATMADVRKQLLGGETSDRQGDDLLGVVRAQTGRLDLDDLRRWSREQGTTDLLERLFTEATSQPV